MFPPFACDSTPEEAQERRRRHQQRKLRTLTFWRDGLERQLAALQAAISTLEQQMARD
ncbi:MAG: sigma factor SigF [Synechococcaceae cyanobacterium ELA445]|jgi:hypothetical protein